jgi:hypothetical protein
MGTQKIDKAVGIALRFTPRDVEIGVASGVYEDSTRLLSLAKSR